MSSRSPDDRLAELARLLPSGDCPDEDQDSAYDTYWQAVADLHRSKEEGVFQAARSYATSELPGKRTIAADVLGQLGCPERPFRSRSIPTISALLMDSDLRVVESAIYATGHLGATDYLEILSAYVTHESTHLRHALTHSLGCEEEPSAIEMLVTLSADPDPETRNWATFALGTLSEDGSESVRGALVSRLRDEHDEARGEALLGLAVRKDLRVLEPLLRELESEVVGSLAVEAASELGDSRLYPVLKELTDWWDVDSELLAVALESCRQK